MSGQQPDPASGLPHGANRPQHIYGGSGPAGGPYSPAPRKSNAAAVLLGVFFVIFLLCGGCVALGVVASMVTSGDGDTVVVESSWSDTEWQDDETEEPAPVMALRKVRPGQAFKIKGYAVQPGWAAHLDGTISKLRVKSLDGAQEGQELIFRIADGQGARAEAFCPLDLTRKPKPVFCATVNPPVLDQISTIKAGLR
jgi:hypothetical protein